MDSTKNSTKDNKLELTNQTVLQPYSLTMSKHKLTAVEMRIMAHILIKLKDEQINSFDSDVVNTSDLLSDYKTIRIRSADVVVSDNHRVVKAALKSLRARDIELKTVLKNGKKGVAITGLITKGVYANDGSEIIIDVDAELLPELTQLGKNYTKHGLEFLFKTSSSHAIRWYQIGSHWLDKGFFYMSKDDIRKTFQVEDKYKSHRDFVRYVITRPLEREVNKKSNINLVVHETKKQGRSVIGFTFKVTSKEPKKVVSEDRSEKPLTKKQATMYAEKIVKHCTAHNMSSSASEVHDLGNKLGHFNSWYDAKDLIWRELQDKDKWAKYKDILEAVGYVKK